LLTSAYHILADGTFYEDLPVVSIPLPSLSPRQAEAVIDLFGQIQAALWDTYGDAIVADPQDADEAIDRHVVSYTSSGNDDPAL
jgi:hypothetical protein